MSDSNDADDYHPADDKNPEQPAFQDNGPDNLDIYDPKRCTNKQLMRYVDNMITDYTNKATIPTEVGENLWHTFREDFMVWDEEDLNRVGTKHMQRLRNALFHGGVYIEKDGGRIIPRLMEIIHRPKHIAWPVVVEWVPAVRLELEGKYGKSPTGKSSNGGKQKEENQDDVEDW